jgi:aspartate/tyrosine/aromatic aminotransferase
MTYQPFAAVEMAPPDPILGINEGFRKDANPRKINLSIGVFQDESGTNPVLRSVKQAERMWLEQERTKEYLGIPGEESYGRFVREVVFGPDHPAIQGGRAVTLQAPGGTGALKVGADFLKSLFPGATVWISDPSWPNHRGLFLAAGLKADTYPYYDAETRGLRFEAMLEALGRVPEGDVVLLHGCCHNPTGVDPTPAQWDRIVELFVRRPIIPFVDFAYQGFGLGVEEDAYAVRAFARASLELLVANSFSKNFGLYRERVGALTILTANGETAEKVMSRAKQNVRTNYSSPPAHGGKVVELVLGTPELRALWRSEVEQMRDRIHGMRRLFVDTLKKKGVKQDFSFLLEQRGMFSFSGITTEQVRALRSRFGIYMVENGRINVAAMTTANMDYLCEGIAQVLQGNGA